MKIGTHFVLVKGTGSDVSALGSFDSALLEAGISDYNLVKVSSIMPANMTLEKSVNLPGGNVIFIAYATKTILSNDLIAAAIAVAMPVDKSKIGVIMEVSDTCSEKEAIEKAESLAVNAMRKRNLEVEKVLSCGTSSVGNGSNYTTVFAGIAMY